MVLTSARFGAQALSGIWQWLPDWLAGNSQSSKRSQDLKHLPQPVRNYALKHLPQPARNYVLKHLPQPVRNYVLKHLPPPALVNYKAFTSPRKLHGFHQPS